MAKKKTKQDSILFSGESSNDVTGSQYFIQFGKYKCLLECGLHQSSSNSYLDSYRVNSKKFKFKPSEIDYVFVCHPHIDHCGLLPRLVKEGFNGRIITTKNTAAVMKSLLFNSCYIVQEEAQILSKRYGRNYMPLYEKGDVVNTLDKISVYDEYHQLFKLNDTIAFQWLSNSHCVGAAQLQLILTANNKTKKILYTSDIGALHSKNHYVDDTEIPSMYNDVVIMESTYGSNSKNIKANRDHDIKHLRSAIDTAMCRGGCVILPCFSFSRTQELLTALYTIYSSDKSFNYQIIVDSMLSCEISKLYCKLLDGLDSKLWDEVFNWKNVKFISDKDDSQTCLCDNSPKVIISSSGFCTNGRVVNYLKKYLRDAKSIIVFSGFTGDNQSYLSYRIKNYRDHKFIKISKENIPNKADCVTLSSFSSHANQSDLLKYGSSLNAGKLILVHGSDQSKRCLCELLKNAISKNNKSYRVICSTKDMVVHL